MHALAHHAVVTRIARPKAAPIGVRFEQDMLAEIDAVVDELRRPGTYPTRGDAIRVLVHEAVEARRGRRKPAKK